MGSTWDKEKIKNAFYNFYNEKGRVPLTKEMRKKHGLPSWKHTMEITETNSLDSFYESIGLKRIPTESTSKIPEELIKNECIRMFSILNRLPKKSEIEEMCVFSSHPFYNYGGIQDTFEYFGVYTNTSKTDEAKISDSIAEIKRLSDELFKSPTADDYDKLKTKGFPRRTLEKKLGIKWNEILSKYSNYSVNIDTNTVFQKEDILKSMCNFRDKLGRTPEVNEIRKYNVGYGRKNILRTFEIKTIAELYPILGWETLGSDIFISTEDEILESFKKFVDEYSRLPSSGEYKTKNKLFSKKTYEKRYGSIENLCNILGIDYISMKNNCGSGTICYDKSGEVCKSLSEMNITNFLIENSISYKKESSYSEFFEDDNRRFDWKIFINNNFYYVEYFGLYRENPKRKFEIDYHIKTNKKIYDLTELNAQNKCIFIFPNDYYSGSYKDIIVNKINYKTPDF